MGFTKILLASDGSDNALRAAAAAAELACRFGSTVTIVHVVNTTALVIPSSAPGAELSPSILDPYLEEVEDAVARRTGRVLEEAGIEYTTRIEIGHPAETIVNVAEAEHCDLVVLGSRGLSEIRSFLMGSVSDRVAHHAHCPVLIVK